MGKVLGDFGGVKGLVVATMYCPFETNLQAPILCDTSRFFSWEFRLHFSFFTHVSFSSV